MASGSKYWRLSHFRNNWSLTDIIRTNNIMCFCAYIMLCNTICSFLQPIDFTEERYYNFRDIIRTDYHVAAILLRRSVTAAPISQPWRQGSLSYARCQHQLPIHPRMRWVFIPVRETDREKNAMLRNSASRQSSKHSVQTTNVLVSSWYWISKRYIYCMASGSRKEAFIQQRISIF